MSRVIRGGSPPRVVPGEVASAREEAAKILADARAEASRIVAAASTEAERIEREARDRGLESARNEIAKALLDAGRARDGALSSAEREVQTLALVAAGRIVGESVPLAPERIGAIVREVLSRARRARNVEIRIHPDDVPALARTALEGARIVPDPSIGRGGCIVASELGRIDARVEVQLAAMADLLGCERP